MIGGYTAGTGNRSSTFGALLVGRYDGDVLVFAGGVGTGFTQRTLEVLGARLKALRTEHCPFEPPPPREYLRGATWVEPVLRAIVEIAEFTNEGFVRHSSFIELPDPDPPRPVCFIRPVASSGADERVWGMMARRDESREEAVALDAGDPLAGWRDEFLIPDPRGRVSRRQLARHDAATDRSTGSKR